MAFKKSMTRVTVGRRVPAAKWRGVNQSPEYRAAIEGLTNHERNQWANAGYPGKRDHDPEKVLPFRVR